MSKTFICCDAAEELSTTGKMLFLHMLSSKLSFLVDCAIIKKNSHFIAKFHMSHEAERKKSHPEIVSFMMDEHELL